MVDILDVLLEEFESKMRDFNPGIKRDLDFPDIDNKIMVAIGMRRVGKTHLLLQRIHRLLNEAIPLSRILYVNFEDDRMNHYGQKEFSALIGRFYELYPENHSQMCYLFFDEIQNVDAWQDVLRRIFDTKKVKIFITGSSARLLSKEISTSLRGRSFSLEVWPFSFCEKQYLDDPSFSLKTQKTFGNEALDVLKKNLNIYLEQGGFPESINLNMSHRNQLLQDYVSVVIFRDIIERYKINNISLVKYLIKTMLKNSGCSLSTNKLFNDLKSQGFQVGKMTIYDYLSYIEDAYLAFSVPLYSESLRKVESNPKKIYAIDTGLIKSYSVSFLENKGHLFENMVFLDLKRKGHEIYYYLTKTRKEIDFLSCDKEGVWHMYQVCYDMQDQATYEREISALNEAEEELGVKGKIVTPESYLTSFLKDEPK